MQNQNVEPWQIYLPLAWWLCGNDTFVWHNRFLHNRNSAFLWTPTWPVKFSPNLKCRGKWSTKFPRLIIIKPTIENIFHKWPRLNEERHTYNRSGNLSIPHISKTMLSSVKQLLKWICTTLLGNQRVLSSMWVIFWQKTKVTLHSQSVRYAW